MGTKKIRFLPTPEQQEILMEWMGTARYTYNQTIHKIKNEKQKINFYSLRNKIVPKKKIKQSKQWILNTPKDIRAASVKEVVTAFKSAFSNLRNRNINHFKIQYRCKKKQLRENIVIPKTAIKRLEGGNSFKLYCRRIKTSIHTHHEHLEEINHEIRIIHIKKCNLWYLCVPIDYKISNPSENQARNGNVVSIDPGIKTFLTLYDKDGKIIKIGRREDLVPQLYRIDKIRSLIDRKSDFKSSKKYNLRRRFAKRLYRLKNYILEIHNKTCKFICSNYKTVLIPNIGNIKIFFSKSQRNLLSWNHSKFIERLKHCGIKNNTSVKIVTEEYTSKTCGSCGWLNNKLSNKDVFHCSKCDLKIDRDCNGARNILLKNLK